MEIGVEVGFERVATGIGLCARIAPGLRRSIADGDRPLQAFDGFGVRPLRVISTGSFRRRNVS
jgi:hypothetical protein